MKMRGWTRMASLLLVEAILVGVSGVPAYAQFPDVLSEVECPGCSATLAALLPFEGTWSTAVTTADAADWAPEDFACVTACTDAGRARATALLADSRTPAVQLLPALAALNVRPLRFGCDTLGFVEQVASPLPLSIRREGGALVLRYEEGAAVQTIALDRRALATGDVTGDARLGTSMGRFERDTLVVETRGAGVSATERYSISADGRWLDLALTLVPAGKNERGVTLTKRWLRTPTARVVAGHCDVMSAGLEASLADYIDPRKLDARR